MSVLGQQRLFSVLKIMPQGMLTWNVLVFKHVLTPSGAVQRLKPRGIPYDLRTLPMLYASRRLPTPPIYSRTS
ncbi:hypothetical protein KJ359_001950 [Pestalotiopsis sp. 9143b]|nr:hypothetical protein KJ359_001950 [Pestalotiopsis sp. 9143b]